MVSRIEGTIVAIRTNLFIISVAAGIEMAILFFIKGARPDWLWRGGRGDLMQTILLSQRRIIAALWKA